MVEMLEPALSEVCISSIDGDVDEVSGLHQGHVSIIMDNGATYDGDCVNGLMHGKGVFIWPNGVKYDGDFKYGDMNGHGCFTWNECASYSGGIKLGKRHGKGIFENIVGQMYDGDWVDGMRHGHGKMFYDKNHLVVYEGYWLKGQREGCGVMQYASGNTYEGEWQSDRKNGRGLMVWLDRREAYLGTWSDDNFHGNGEHFFDANDVTSLYHRSNVYRGTFRNGLRHGQGTFFYADGSQYSGLWKDNKKHDEHGLFFSTEGYLSIGVYHDDNLVKNMERTDSTLGLRDFATCFHVNILDALCNVCATLDPMAISTNIDKFGEKLTELSEIERVLLRYDGYLKLVYRHYRDIAHSDRLLDKMQRETNRKHMSSGSIAMSVDIDAYLLDRRNLTDRVFCMSLASLQQFAYESGLVDGIFGIFDVEECIRNMYKQQQAIAYTLQRNARHMDDSTSVIAVETLSCLDYHDHSVNTMESFFTIGVDPLSPNVGVTESDFVELFVRCHIEKHTRSSDSVSSLAKHMHTVLANEVFISHTVCVNIHSN